MYSIYCDGQLVYDPRDEDKPIISGSVSLAVNTPGECSFELPPTHEVKQYIKKLKSVIQVYDDEELLFQGRVIFTESDMYGITNYTCEGELAFLLDSIQRPKKYGDLTPRSYLQDKINQHNKRVESGKQFTLGIVEKQTMNYDAREDNQYTNTFDTIMDKLIVSNGGYLRVRYENNMRYLDYLESYGRTSTQTIRFGQNILDLAEHINAEDIITVLIPLGKAPDNAAEGEKLTITSVNNGNDYLEDAEGINLYGRVEGTNTWDEVTLPANLKSKGQEYLNTIRNLAITIELTAVDLHLVDVDIDRIKLGDMVPVVSVPHKLDKYMFASKRSYNLLNPAQDKIILGDTISTLTDKQAAIQKAVNNQQDVKAEVQALNSSVAQVSVAVEKMGERVQTIDDNYTPLSEQIDNIGNQVTGIKLSHESYVIEVTNQFGNILKRLQVLEGGETEA